MSTKKNCKLHFVFVQVCCVYNVYHHYISTMYNSFYFLSTISSLLVFSNGLFVQESPFDGTSLYIPKYYQAEVQTSIDAHPSDASMLQVAQNVSVAFWIDTMAKISNATQALADATEDQKNSNVKYTVVLVVYDLPDRDCAALASNGEITCEDSTCAAGISEYETNYIDPIIAMLKKYTDLNIVVVLEPDSLPNLATNMDLTKCQQAEIAYKTGVEYAIAQLSTLSNVAIYIDAAHGGWLGWPNNQAAFGTVMVEVLDAALKIVQIENEYISIDGKKIHTLDIESGADLIRGFASNTANYQPLGSVSSTDDPCNLENEGNSCINEAIYITDLTETFSGSSIDITINGWITDTSRNGVTNMRSDCANWCNIEGAGLGERPNTDTSYVESLTGASIIDALIWVKVPGESDGTSNTSSSRYDAHCTSSDSQVPAPQAGQWFDTYFVDLCTNAVPPLLS